MRQVVGLIVRVLCGNQGLCYFFTLIDYENCQKQLWHPPLIGDSHGCSARNHYPLHLDSKMHL